MEKSNAKPGDRVSVLMVKKEYRGTLLETPQDEKGIILLKLDSGYNIGIHKKDTLEVKLLKKGKDVEEKFELKRDNDKPNVAMIITGGTIAARLNPKKGGVDWLDTSESLLKYYPEIFDKVNIAKIERPFMKAS